MKISFGIREKTALLVIILVTAAAFFTPQYIVNFAMDKYVDRELVDLSDEANLRTWEIRDEIESLQRTTWELATEAEFRDGFEQLVREEAKEFNENDRRWKNYIRIEVCTADGSEKQDLLPPMYPGIDPRPWEPLLRAIDGARSNEPMLSSIDRVNVGSEEKPKWIPVICAGARIQDSTSGSPSYVRVMLSLDRPRSNRHLLLLIDEDRRFLLHPNELSDEDLM